MCKNISSWYKRINDIRNRIYKKDCNIDNALIELNDLKGEILDILYTCNTKDEKKDSNSSNKQNKNLKTFNKAIDNLLNDIDSRICDIYIINLIHFINPNILRLFRRIMNSSFMSFLVDILYLLAQIIFAIKIVYLLQDSLIISPEEPSEYKLIIIFCIIIFFHLSKIKIISKDGIAFRKRRNWE